MRTFLTRHLPAILWAGLIGFLLMLPKSTFTPIFRWVPEWLEGRMDKGLHVVMFLVLAILLLRSAQAIEAFRRPVLAVLVAILVYMLFLETVQTGVPGRGRDLLDLLAGGVGAVVGLLIASWGGPPTPAGRDAGRFNRQG